MMRWIASLAATAASFATYGALAEMDPATRLLPTVSAPDPSTAWVLAAGFLGLVVLRRMRSGPID